MLVSDVGAGDIMSILGDTRRGAEIWSNLNPSKRLWRLPLGVLGGLDSVQLSICQQDCGFSNAESRVTQTWRAVVYVSDKWGGGGMSVIKYKN